jgi:hypothetical protein
MKHVLRILSFILMSQLFITESKAQETNFKFGKPDLEALEMKIYPLDTAAEAVILFDKGYSFFMFNSGSGSFELVYERQTRIKFINKNGYDWATHQISLYHNGSSRERLTELKGFTFNHVDGKIVKTKLEKDGIFEEAKNKSWDLVKFTMPDVKEGTVIDFSYTITSPFYTFLQDWQFQHTIPVAWSEYTTEIPEFYNYLHLSQGYAPLLKVEHGEKKSSLNYIHKDEYAGSTSHTSRIEYNIHTHFWAGKNMPALRFEKFIATPEDFLTRIDFQLASIKYPQASEENILGDWEEIEKKLQEDAEFGATLKKTGFCKDALENIVQKYPTDSERAFAVLQMIKDKIRWNDEKRMYLSKSLKKVWEDGNGNSADLNLLLVATLRDIGIKADPVIISTRDHGRVHPVYPILNKFNYVLASVTLDGKSMLLDATHPLIPGSMLPEFCLNGQGRIIAEKPVGWIDLNSKITSGSTIMATLTLGPAGMLTGNFDVAESGYKAYKKRKSILKDGESEYIHQINQEKDDFTIEKFEFKHLKDLDENLVGKFEIRAEVETLGDLIFVQPLISDERITENPFKQEKRDLPIDFNYPMGGTYILNLTIPEGYEIDEIPISAKVVLPENGGMFSYMIRREGNRVNLVNSYKLNKTFWSAEEYELIKKFFDLMVQKHSEQIVLKKV